MLRLLATLTALVLSACALADETPAYRYRLTVEVETPGGVRTGSSVIEVDTAVSQGIPTPGAVQHRVRGEAVAVDLPGGRTLFALLRSPIDSDWASRVMFMLAPEGRDEDGDLFLGTYANMLEMEGPRVLPRFWPERGGLPERTAFPMLVTFRDPADPASVEEVDPDDLAATFGDGMRLKRVTVELTEDAVTEGLVQRLPWLPGTYSTMLDGRSNNTLYAENRLANDLQQGDFSRGVLR